MTRTAIVTYTGKVFDLAAPDPGLVDIRDIARGLALCNRFSGQTYQPVTVAQHCYKVSEWCAPEDAPYALLHDAAEAYVGHVAKPLKVLIPQYAQTKTRVMAAILACFRLEPTENQMRRIDHWDALAARSESRYFPSVARAVFRQDAAGWSPVTEPAFPWDYRSAERFFMHRYRVLSREFAPFAEHLNAVTGTARRESIHDQGASA